MLSDLKSGTISGDNVLGSMLSVSKISEEKMGGTSGALYSWVLAIDIIRSG